MSAHSIILMAMYCSVVRFLFVCALCVFYECLLLPESWWQCIAVYFSSHSFVSCAYLFKVCSFHNRDGNVLLCTSVLSHCWAVRICWMSAHSIMVMAMHCCVLQFLFIRGLICLSFVRAYLKHQQPYDEWYLFRRWRKYLYLHRSWCM